MELFRFFRVIVLLSLIDLRNTTIIMIGTKWCGNGHRARYYQDIGYFGYSDKCCRGHDYCKDGYRPYEQRNGFKNPSRFSMMHCSCDQKFSDCLTTPGKRDLGSPFLILIFFHILQLKCYIEVKHDPDDDYCDHPKVVYGKLKNYNKFIQDPNWKNKICPPRKGLDRIVEHKYNKKIITTDRPNCQANNFVNNLHNSYLQLQCKNLFDWFSAVLDYATVSYEISALMKKDLNITEEFIKTVDDATKVNSLNGYTFEELIERKSFDQEEGKVRIEFHIGFSKMDKIILLSFMDYLGILKNSTQELVMQYSDNANCTAKCFENQKQKLYVALLKTRKQLRMIETIVTGLIHQLSEFFSYNESKYSEKIKELGIAYEKLKQASVDVKDVDVSRLNFAKILTKENSSVLANELADFNAFRRSFKAFAEVLHEFLASFSKSAPFCHNRIVSVHLDAIAAPLETMASVSANWDREYSSLSTETDTHFVEKWFNFRKTSQSIWVVTMQEYTKHFLHLFRGINLCIRWKTINVIESAQKVERKFLKLISHDAQFYKFLPFMEELKKTLKEPCRSWVIDDFTPYSGVSFKLD